MKLIVDFLAIEARAGRDGLHASGEVVGVGSDLIAKFN
jgi:hypothetical protein